MSKAFLFWIVLFIIFDFGARKENPRNKKKTIIFSITSVKKYVSQFLNFKSVSCQRHTFYSRHTDQKWQSYRTFTPLWNVSSWCLADTCVWHKSNRSIVYNVCIIYQSCFVKFQFLKSVSSHYKIFLIFFFKAISLIVI